MPQKCTAEELTWIAHIRKNVAKPANFAIIYGAGVKGLSNTVAGAGVEDGWVVAKRLLKSTRGEQNEYGEYSGGLFSGFFNYGENIALKQEIPTLPVLGTQISEALRPNAVGKDFKNCRLNFTVQASGAEMLSVILSTAKMLSDYFKIPMHFVISVHDELCFMCTDENAEKGAMIMQLAHLYTWALFFYKVGINDLPLSRAFFSEIAIDQRFRKSPTESTKTISQSEDEPDGKSYNFEDLVHILQELKK